MIEREKLTDGTVVAWQGPNGLVRGIVEVTDCGESYVTLEDGRHMDLDAIAGSPSSKILGQFKAKR